jgi:rSAM/selenodomain-associated transferase 1
MADIRRALLVMAKRPEAGATKTRLCPPLTPERAAALYACFLADVIETARAAAGIVPSLCLAIAYAPVGAAGYFRALAPDFALVLQTGATLGERLSAVMGGALASGHAQVAAINSDSPSLPVTYLAQAFAALDDPATDLVLGPCDDGGYYLIGWKRPLSFLVRDVAMSTPNTLADTLALADAAGLRVALLPPWYDVDGPEDLERLTRDVGLGRHTREFLDS